MLQVKFLLLTGTNPKVNSVPFVSISPAFWYNDVTPEAAETGTENNPSVNLRT